MEKGKQTYKLPEGWIEVSIRDILVLEYGKSLPKKNRIESGGYKVYGSNGVIGNHIDTLVDGPVIIVGRKGSVGKVQYESENCWPIDTTYYIKTGISLNDKYIYHLLSSLNLSSLDSSTAIPGINRNQVYDIRVNLPPLLEQQRIVSKIESLFSELDQAEKGLQKAKKQLEIYQQASLKSAFDGKLTEVWRGHNPNHDANSELSEIKNNRKSTYNQILAEGLVKKPKADFKFDFKEDNNILTWSIAKLENLIDINARIGWRGLTKKEYTKEGALFLSVHALNYGKDVVFDKANHISIDRYNESPEIKLEVNNILLCKDGAGIGKVGIIKNLPDIATVNSSLLVISAKEVFNPDFLYYFFYGPSMQQLVKEKISGSAIPHLFQKDIKEFTLKVPPKKEQDQIVKILDSRFTLIENLDKSIEQSLKDIILFKHSILKKAFEGRLVNQDSIEESADELLQKIRIEKTEYLKAQKILEKLKPKKKSQMEKKKTVLEILKESNEPISTQELWTNSIHDGDIESFYSEIKEIHNKLDEVKESTESLLSLKK